MAFNKAAAIPIRFAYSLDCSRSNQHVNWMIQQSELSHNDKVLITNIYNTCEMVRPIAANLFDRM